MHCIVMAKKRQGWRERFDKGGDFVKNPKNGFPGIPCPFYLRGGFCGDVPAITRTLGPPDMEP
jgi:hypothetical protein